MRELLPRVSPAPSDLRRKVFVVAAVQRIKEGWDVLLKTLEEPPDDVVFIFCTTNPAGIRPAVVSRLQRYTFRPLTIPEITGKLGRILEGEGRTAEPAAVALVAELAAGGMRDAESMLDQLLSTASDPLTLADVRELLGLADTAAVDTFVDALAGIDPLAGIAVLEALEENGRDLVAFADQVVARLREALVSRLRGDPGPTSGTSGPSAAALAQAARRLSALDTARVGAGGYRFQLELAVLQTTTVQSTPADRPTSERSPSERPISDPEPVSAESSPPEIAPAQTNPLPDLAPAQPNGRPRPADSPVDAPRTLPTPAQTPEPPAPAAAGSPLDQLRRSWPDVVAHVARNPANRPLITACRPVEVEGHVVVLGFPEDQAFLRDIAERKRTALEEAVQLVLGPAYGVRCIATNLEALPPLPEAETIDLVEHARRIFGGDIADVAEVS
ncbi:MAG: hypothetical protein ACR2JZ_04950 [Candidatus Limnocylindrales bacterium]